MSGPDLAGTRRNAMEYDVATGNNTHRKGEVDVDDTGIAWVSGRGGVRGYADDTFPLEVVGVTPHGPDVGTADWLMV
jgi:hypothetical protein